MEGWTSPHKLAFDELSTGTWIPHTALAAVRAWEDAKAIPSPSVYVSTAITSGGYRRDVSLSIDVVIQRNNRSAGLLVGALCDQASEVVRPDRVMVPTELGHVAGWQDTDYLQFYFAYAAGLSVDAADRFDASLADPVYERIKARANDRSLSNEERKPEYFAFTEVALSQLAQVDGRRGAVAFDPFDVMVQLIDADYSLGCQAEARFATARGLDVVAPSCELVALGEELNEDLCVLAGLGAVVGVTRKAIELVPRRLSSLMGQR